MLSHRNRNLLLLERWRKLAGTAGGTGPLGHCHVCSHHFLALAEVPQAEPNCHLSTHGVRVYHPLPRVYLQYTASERTPQTAQQTRPGSSPAAHVPTVQGGAPLCPSERGGRVRTGCSLLIFIEHLLRATLYLKSFPPVISLNSSMKMYGLVNGQSPACY